MVQTQVTTVDSIVRSYINSKGMVWHDYFRLLVIALDGVRNIAMDVNIGNNRKILEIDVDEFGNAWLPSDCVEVDKISVGENDKLYGMSKVLNINPIPKTDSKGNQVKRTNEHGYWPDYHINSQQMTGRYYGIPEEQKHLFQVFNDRIQLDSRLKLKCVYVMYTTRGVNMSDANVVHPWAEDAIKTYIDWKYVESRKGIWENQNDRRYFFIEKKNLYSRIHGFGYEDYMEIVRSSNVLTYKT